MPASETLKMLLTFPIRFLTMPALVAGATGISGIHNDQKNPFFFGLVSQKGAQLCERPLQFQKPILLALQFNEALNRSLAAFDDFGRKFLGAIKDFALKGNGNISLFFFYPQKGINHLQKTGGLSRMKHPAKTRLLVDSARVGGKAPAKRRVQVANDRLVCIGDCYDEFVVGTECLSGRSIFRDMNATFSIKKSGQLRLFHFRQIKRVFFIHDTLSIMGCSHDTQLPVPNFPFANAFLD